MNLSSKVMLTDVPKLCLLVATLAVGSASGHGPCERGRSWWDRERRACIPCTKCDPKFVVQRPCDSSSDTVCQHLNNVRIGLFPKDNDYSDYVYDEHSQTDAVEVNDDDEVKWDLQAASLVIAASGCVVFFVVVVYLTWHHSKQWKALKRTLKSDAEELSAKLKLMEAGESPAQTVSPADHHIYCNVHVAKDPALGPVAKKKGLGNVYTQEKHSS